MGQKGCCMTPYKLRWYCIKYGTYFLDSTGEYLNWETWLTTSSVVIVSLNGISILTWTSIVEHTSVKKRRAKYKFERAKHVECQNNTYISRKSNDRNPIGIATDSTTQRFDNIIHQLFCMFEIVRLNFELRGVELRGVILRGELFWGGIILVYFLILVFDFKFFHSWLVLLNVEFWF